MASTLKVWGYVGAQDKADSPFSVSWVSRQVHLPAGGGTEDARGLLWVLDEEVRVEGSSDSVVLDRLRAAFEKGAGAEGKGARVWGVLSPARVLGSVCISQEKP